MSGKSVFTLAVTTAAVLFCPTVLFAQSSDTAMILKAIQGVNKRVDTLQKEIDKLKTGQAETSDLPPSPSSAAPAKAAKAPTKSIGGWHVGAVPGDDDNKDAVGGFAGPLSDFKFSMHTKAVHDTNQYSYHGEAVFQVDSAGRYVFVLNFKPVSHYGNGYYWYNCEGSLNINGETVVKGITNYAYAGGETDKNHDVLRTQGFSGGADLQAGRYPITFKVGCWLANNKHDINLDNPDLFQSWERNSFQILVKGPEDDAPRAFEANELFHPVKGRS